MAAIMAMIATTTQVMGLAHSAALKSHRAPVATNMPAFHKTMAAVVATHLAGPTNNIKIP